MRPSLVLELQTVRLPLLGCADGLIGVQLDLLIFHTPPQPFQEHLVPPAALGIPADGDDVAMRQVHLRLCNP